MLDCEQSKMGAIKLLPLIIEKDFAVNGNMNHSMIRVYKSFEQFLVNNN